MFFTIYKTTNNLNGKIYIGQHGTNNLNDGYMGSGTAIQDDIKSFGVENFKKEILYIFETFSEMNQKEKELVTLDFVKRTDTYNLVPGGHGGNMFIGEHRKFALNLQKDYGSIGQKITCDLINKHNPGFWKEFSEIGTKTLLEKYPVGTSSSFALNKENQQKALIASQSDESKQKRKETLRKIGHQTKEKNSQFGTCWIYNLKLRENKKVDKYQLDDWLLHGWIKGRKIFGESNK